MTSNDDAATKRRATGSDLVIPIAAILLTVYYFSTILKSPWTAQVTAFFVGAILIALSLFYIAKSVLQLRRRVTRFSLMDLVEPVNILPQRAALFALTLASLMLISTLGFTLTAITFLASAILLLNRGRQAGRILVISVSLSITWFILFVLVFQRRFPLGWLDHQIAAVIKPLLQAVGLG
jgi:hypothetical protein